jgi:membrane-associated phospholipid phosphatase
MSHEPITRPDPWALTRDVRIGAVICLLLLCVAAPLTIIYLDAAITRELAKIPRDVQLAFDAITEIGNSRWYMFPSLALAALIALYLRYGHPVEKARRIWRWLSGSFLFLFFSVFIPGFFLNLVKWTAGRARPKLMLREEYFGFDPIKFDPDYNSFPSGHAQVSICVALAVGCFFPKARPWLLAVAVIIAVSRIVILVHFISDVMASIAIALSFSWVIQAWYRDKGYLFTPAPGGGWRVKPEGRWIGQRIKRFFGQLPRRRRA